MDENHKEPEERDPSAEAISRMREQVEAGDFRQARRVIEEEMPKAGMKEQPRLQESLKQLDVDPAALVVFAICSVILIVIAALTLFH